MHQRENLMPHQYEGTTHTRQIGSIQDLVASGFNTNTKVWWMLVGDGHGLGGVVTKARKYNWSALGELPDVDIQTIVQPFVNATSGPETAGDGMTATIVRCIPDHTTGDTIVEVAWIGDSSVSVAKTSGPSEVNNRDGDILFFNKAYVIHPSLQDGVTSEDAPTFKAVSETELRAIEDKYFVFPSKNGGKPEKINMTGSWGHGGATVHPLFQRSLVLNGEDSFIVRAASDGWWDMMCDWDWQRMHDPNVTSGELTALAEERWRKMDWLYNPNVEGKTTDYPPVRLKNGVGEPDDIAVGTIVIYPEPEAEMFFGARRPSHSP